jgi:DNA-binding NtrC family response regulator
LADVLAVMQADCRTQPCAVTATLREARDQFERNYIVAVLHRHRGRIPDAARSLGIERSNLYRKIRRLRIRVNRAGFRRQDPGRGTERALQEQG